ncbi:LamG-like jellyroll fold domain-containing protein [Streptomyces sp. NPDC090127]|uniref:LamG-like jellyroll fold domain-containing protein n=1 Tax=Streptomyces sp. NPDC090127 TaxID=3365953 RepID=UPI00381170C8
MMAVLAGTEQAALAVTRWVAAKAGPGAGELPEQGWGSARGRGHSATGDATDAAAAGGRRGALKAPGELAPDSGASAIRLGGAPKPPAKLPYARVPAPKVEAPKGFDAKASTELPEKRTERGRTFRNEDGTFTTRFYNEPVNFKAADGKWKDIDTRLARADDSGPRTMTGTSGPGWETRSTEDAVSFADYADADVLVRLTAGGSASIGYAVDGAARSRGRVAGSVITYPEIRPSADLELVAGSDSVKETLVLKSAQAPSEWRFPLALNGLTAKLDGHGGVSFVDASGRQRAGMPPGWMEDSAKAPHSDEGVISSGVTYRLEGRGNRQVLVVSLDRQWLSAPERVFPVKVDPSVESATATSDTYVESPYNQNFSSDKVLKAGTYDAGSHKAASFLKFGGLESTLKNAWVVDARLALFNSWSYSCTARPVTVHAVTSNWAESTTKTYPGPATGPALGSKSFAHGWLPEGASNWACAPAWEAIPLGAEGRQLVDDWTHGRKPNYGLAVKASTSDSKSWKKFHSEDEAGGKPSLDVTWTKYGATYGLGGFVQPMTATTEGTFKVTVTNQGQQTWGKDSNYKLRYDLFDANGNQVGGDYWSKIRWTPMPHDVAPGASVTLDAKIAPLAPATYTLVWTMDEYGVSSFAAAGVPGPAVKFDAVNVPPYLTSAAPPSGTVVDTRTPTLWARATDVDKSPGALTYQFEICEVEGKDVRKNCRGNTHAASESWTVPADWLTWAKTYAWYAYANDGKDQSTRTAPSLLTTQVPQPVITSHLGGGDSGRGFGERSGNYATSATDTAVPVVGPELAVTRTYNSQDPRTASAFGAGWATRWDMRATPEPDGSVVITLATGSQVRFGRNNDGTYSAPSGSMGLLTAVTGGGWTLRDASAALYTFDATGLLTKVKDGHDREQVLTYTGGRLTRATDAVSKRSLTFTWSGAHVASVSTDAVGPSAPALVWSYTYQGDLLTKVCPPASPTACTVYEYTGGSHYRSMVQDANPVAYWRLNEAEGSLAQSEAVSRTGMNAARYRDVTLSGAGVLAGTGNGSASFDGTSSYVELPESTLASSTVLSVEVWFKTDKAGGALVGFQDAPVGPTAPVRYNPVLAIDAAGKLRGAFEKADGGLVPITSATAVNNDVWHHAVLTSTATNQTLYLDGTVVGTLAGPVGHAEKSHAYLGVGYGNSSWDGIAATGNRFFKGSMDEVAVYHRALDAGSVRAHYAARTGTSKLSKVTLPSGRTGGTAEYDGDTGRATKVTDQNGGAWQISAPRYASGSQAYADAVRASDPVNYWRLGDGSGAAAADETAAGGNGSYRDGVTLGGVGAFLDGDDAAITLDGSKGVVSVPSESISNATSLSVELWFRTDKPSGVLLGLQNAELGTVPTMWNASLLVDGEGKLRGHLWDGPSSSWPVMGGVKVTDNQWHHVVITGGPAGQSLYLDGAKIGSKAGVVKPETLVHAYLGAGYSSEAWDGQARATRYFDGRLDEAAFYTEELDAQTVADHYKARSKAVSGSGDQYRGVVTAARPAGYWRLDEATGTMVKSRVASVDGTGTYTKASLGATGAFGPGDGSAVQFGGDGFAELPPVGTVTADVSASVWFRTDKPGVILADQSAPVAGAADASGSWTPVLYVGADGKLHGEYYSAGVTASNASPGTVTDNQWHHAAITAKGGTQTLYLDGAQVATKSAAPVGHQGNSRTFLGAGFAKFWPSAPGNVSYFTGALDEAAVFRRGLSADEVAAQYEARASSSVSALTSTVTVTDPAGAKTGSTFDAVRGQRRVASTNADGGVTTYAYDTGGFLHTVTDPNGHSVVTGHDERGSTVSTTTCRDANSCWTSFAEHHYNEADKLDPRNGKQTAVRDGRSSGPADDRFRTTTSYTALGLIDTVTLPDGRRTSTTYTTGGEPAVGGGVTPKGLVATKKSTGGATVSYAYFANGDLARSTSPSGLVTSYTYDGLGRKLTETHVSEATPDGVTTTYTYTTMSRVSSETGPGVKNEITGVTHTAKVSRTYDADGQLLTESMQDTTGGDATRTATYRYNAAGLNESVTDAAGNESTFGHDALGRVVRETDPAGNVVTHAFTKRGQLAESVLKDWTGDPSGQTRDLVLVSHTYDPAGRLASTTDALGATTAFTYFDDGLSATTTAKQVTQSDGSKRDVLRESLVYDGAGNVTSQTASGGRTTVRTVDATGRLTRSAFDPNGLNRVTTLAYDGDDRVTEESRSIDGSGKRLTSTTEYDTAGNPKKSTVTDGTGTRTSSATFDQRGLALTQVTPRGHTSISRYDVLGRLVETTAPQVQVEENGGAATAATPKAATGYNTFGEATEARDPRGLVTRLETDKLGRPTAVTLPDYTPPGTTTAIAAVTRTTYDQLGNTASTTDPLGRTTSYAYDQLGNLTRRTDPAVTGAQGLQAPGATTFDGTSTDLSGRGVSTYTWTPTGLPLSATDPTGARTESTYDQLGRKLTATTVERRPTLQNLVSRYTWDDADNQIVSVTPGGLRTTASYDTAGQVLTVADPLGGVTRASYDGLGRPTESRDATGRRTVMAYDVLGNLTSSTEYGTGTTALRSTVTEYDADGNVTASVSPTGARRTHTYDAVGRMTKQVEPVTATDSITTTFGYDAAGNRTRLTDGRGKATYYTFNTWGLPESTIEPATSQHWTADVRTWANVYDAAGRLVTELLPGNVKRQKTYDALGRLTGETGSGTAVATRPRTLSYDLAGRLTGAGGDGVLAGNAYTYNDRGQLLTAGGPGGSASYAYDADGRMTSRTDAAGVTAFSYDQAGRLDTTTDPLTGTQVRSDYDAAGRPTLQEFARPTGGGQYAVGAKRSYAYDGLGRLAKDAVTRTDTGVEVESMAYEYDQADLLVKKTTAGTAGAGEYTYAYDKSGRMISMAAGGTTTPYEWDKSGNLTRKGDITATYDSRNRLETWGAQTFAYSARGTAKSVTEGGVTRQIGSDAFERTVTNGTSTFTYDSLDRVMTHNGASFAYDGGSNNLVKDGTTTYSRNPGGALLASATSGTAGSARLAVADRHTDLVAGLTPDGTSVASSRAYDPFGKVTASSGGNPALGYQSGWTDSSTGEVNMASRWYQPGIGSFTSRDTWQLNPNPSVQSNRYTYANASPLNGTDPSGHFVWFLAIPAWKVAVALTAAVAVGAAADTAIKADWSTDTDWNWRSNDKQKDRWNPQPRPRPFDIWDEKKYMRDQRKKQPQPQAQAQPKSTYCQRNPWLAVCGGGKKGAPPKGSAGSGGGGCRSWCRTSWGNFPGPSSVDDDNVNVNPWVPPPVVVPNRKPEVAMDAVRAGQWTLADGWEAMFGSADFLEFFKEHPDFDPDGDIAADYGLGLHLTPSEENEGAFDSSPVDRGGCKRGNSAIYYMPLDSLGRAQGARACLNRGDYNYTTGKENDRWKFDTEPTNLVGTGTEWPLGRDDGWNNQPRGWKLGEGLQRGHLIAKSLGGSGEDARNLVPLYNKSNAPDMSNIERELARRVEGGETLYYSVTPQYIGNNPIPARLHLGWIGNREGAGYAVVENYPH